MSTLSQLQIKSHKPVGKIVNQGQNLLLGEIVPPPTQLWNVTTMVVSSQDAKCPNISLEFYYFYIFNSFTTILRQFLTLF